MSEKYPEILMVEDNVNVLHLNRSVLERQGYAVLCAENLTQARLLLEAHLGIDIAILDILLPDGNGLEFSKEVKQAVGCPVLMLTSKRSYNEMVEGLTNGADDYLTKPYRIEELAARIHALLRKKHEMPAKTISKGPLLLDISSGRAFLRENDLLLSPREFHVLLCLVQHENSVVSVEILYEEAWKLAPGGDTSAVKTTVSRLRKKLAESGYEIESARGVGYRFRKGE